MKATELIDKLQIAVEMYGDGIVAGVDGFCPPLSVTAVQSEVHSDAGNAVTHWLIVEEY